MERLGIGEICAQYRVSPRTLHYYEEAGLLASHRREGSLYREYDPDQRARLEVILLLRRLSFSIREIGSVLQADGAQGEALLREKIAQSGRQLMEARETDRLLRDLSLELSRRPAAHVSVTQILGQYTYLTKRTERMIPMTAIPQNEKYRVALGLPLALEVCGENNGKLLEKFAALRAELEGKGIQLPKVRIYDTLDLPDGQALIGWEGKIVWREDFAIEEAAACAQEIIGQIRKCAMEA